MEKKDGKVKSGKVGGNFDSKDKNIIKELLKRPEGMRLETIQKLTQIPTRTLYRRLNYMQKEKLVENVFPIWKIVNGQSKFWQSLLKESNIFELHDISYVVKLLKVPEWWSKRKNYLMRLKEWQFKNIDFGKGGSNPYQQLINDNFVIQAYPESLIIIAKKRYYSNNPYETIQNAMSDVLSLLDWFSERFRFNFFADGVPHIEVRNNDFNRMNDAIANQVRKDKNKFLVEIDKRRKVWVDMSEPFGKEANYPEGQEKMEKLTKDILTKKSLLPSEVTEIIGTLGQSQLNQSKQIESFAIALNRHIPAYEGMGTMLGKASEKIEMLGEEIKNLREEISKLKKGS